MVDRWDRSIRRDDEDAKQLWYSIAGKAWTGPVFFEKLSSRAKSPTVPGYTQGGSASSAHTAKADLTATAEHDLHETNWTDYVNSLPKTWPKSNEWVVLPEETSSGHVAALKQKT